MAGTFRLQHYTLVIGASAKQLSQAFTNTGTGSGDDMGCQAISIQADPANTGLIYLGGSNAVSAAVYGIILPIPVSTVPAPPLMLVMAQSRIRLSDFWAFASVATDKIHIMLYGY